MSKVAVKRRDRQEIIIGILKSTKNGKIKTHIMYQNKLSYAQINEYLSLLTGNGLLEPNTVKQGRIVRKLYITTDKGNRYVEKVEEANKIWVESPSTSACYLP